MGRQRTPEQSEVVIQRGREASTILESPVLAQAIVFVEKRALDVCRDAKTPEDAFLGTLRFQAAQDVARMLRAFVADGENAAKELERSLTAQRQRREADESHENYLTAARRARSKFDHPTTATREDETNG